MSSVHLNQSSIPSHSSLPNQTQEPISLADSLPRSSLNQAPSAIVSGSSLAAPSRSSSSMAGRIVPVENARPQYHVLFQRRRERLIEGYAHQMEAAAMKITSFKNIDETVSQSQRILIDDENHLNFQFPIEAASMTDLDTAAHRRGATAFFDACLSFYGAMLLDDLYPPEERARLLEEGAPLEVGKVRDIVKKADEIVQEVVRYLNLSASSQLSQREGGGVLGEDALVELAESRALAHHAEREANAAAEAYERLGPPAQHLLAALGRALMIPVGIGAPLAAAAALPAISGVPHLLMSGASLIPAFSFFSGDAMNPTDYQVPPEQLAKFTLVASAITGGLGGFIGSSAVIDSLTHGAALASLGLTHGLLIMVGSMTLCPVLGFAWVAFTTGSALMALHSSDFPVNESLSRYSESLKAEQHVSEKTAQAQAAYERAIAVAKQYAPPNANEQIPPSPVLEQVDSSETKRSSLPPPWKRGI